MYFLKSRQKNPTTDSNKISKSKSIGTFITPEICVVPGPTIGTIGTIGTFITKEDYYWNWAK